MYTDITVYIGMFLKQYIVCMSKTIYIFPGVCFVSLYLLAYRCMGFNDGDTKQLLWLKFNYKSQQRVTGTAQFWLALVPEVNFPFIFSFDFS